MTETLPQHNAAILPADLPHYTSFIQSQQNAATCRRKIQQLAYFYAWLRTADPTVTTIVDVDPLVFRDYFHYLETTVNAQYGIKAKYKGVLKQFIHWIVRPKLARGEKAKYDYSIIFDREFYPLSDTGTTRHEEPLTKKDIAQCLHFFRSRNERDYMVVAILAYTGMRIGGLLSITVEGIDFEARCITTKEKRTKATTGTENLYPIPKLLVPILKAYVMQFQAIHPDQDVLFPVAGKNLRKQLKKWRDTIHPHLFRDALNMRWADLGMDEGIRAILLNQKPTGVNAQHYLKELKSWTKRLEYYDRFFPY